MNAYDTGDQGYVPAPTGYGRPTDPAQRGSAEPGGLAADLPASWPTLSVRPTENDPPASAPPTGRWERIRKDSAYLLASWPLTMIAFTVVVSLVATGVGTAVIWVGLPILVAGLFVARLAATAERTLIRSWVGKPAPATYLPTRGRTAIGRMLSPLRDPQCWLDALWTLVGFVVSTVTWSLTVTWWAAAVSTVLGPITVWLLPALLGDNYSGMGFLPNGPVKAVAESLVYIVGGLLFTASLGPVTRALAGFQSSVSTALLSSRSQHAAEVASLVESRDAGRKAENDALRRLERDIHDGPQQRLVRLNMDLARARRQAATDPESAQQILADAMQQTQDTLNELRQLSRGIAPPVLVDRGLAAAVEEAAGRCAVPVSVQADVPGDLPDHVSTAAYFTVSEALTNMAKHAQATAASVRLWVEHGWLFVAVVDNGVGRASLAKGHGLSGLEQRLRAVDGRLALDSPVGGPTLVEAAIPLGS